MTTDKRGDRLIIDDPWAAREAVAERLRKLSEETGQPVAISWTPERSARLRPDHLADHAAFAFERTWWQDAEPPRDLGKFNCRGDYVYRPGSILGNADATVIPAGAFASMPCVSFSQSAGQLAEALQRHRDAIASAFRMPVLSPEAHASINAAFAGAARAVQQFGERLRELGYTLPDETDQPRPSKRRRRRARGRARGMARRDRGE